RAVGLNIYLVRDIELGLPILERASVLVGEVPGAQLGQRLHRCAGPQAREPFVEVALHAVFEDYRTARVLALRLVGAPADLPAQDVLVLVLVDHARKIRRINDDRALLLEDGDRLRHHLRLVGVETAARLLGTGRRDALVIERARNANARALQPVG